MGTWLNDDGLYLKFGTTKTTAEVGGEYRTNGELREIEVTIDLTDLTSSAAIVSDTTFFPNGARIEEVEIVTQTAATSAGSATLDIGLIQTDRSTAIDADGLVAALAKTAVDAAGEKNVIRVGSTGAGALIGTTTANVGYITANYGTAAFTAGVIRVRIRYYMP